jgi:hypothetical protein
MWWMQRLLDKYAQFMMNKGCYLKYPCGKLFLLKIPISTVINGKTCSILPGDESYFEYAQQKFQINNLKVIEMEISASPPQNKQKFITLSKKIRAIE